MLSHELEDFAVGDVELDRIVRISADSGICTGMQHCSTPRMDMS